jgi:hypothetical protein
MRGPFHTPYTHTEVATWIDWETDRGQIRPGHDPSALPDHPTSRHDGGVQVARSRIVTDFPQARASAQWFPVTTPAHLAGVSRPPSDGATVTGVIGSSRSQGFARPMFLSRPIPTTVFDSCRCVRPQTAAASNWVSTSPAARPLTSAAANCRAVPCRTNGGVAKTGLACFQTVLTDLHSTQQGLTISLPVSLTTDLWRIRVEVDAHFYVAARSTVLGHSDCSSLSRGLPLASCPPRLPNCLPPSKCFHASPALFERRNSRPMRADSVCLKRASIGWGLSKLLHRKVRLGTYAAHRRCTEES